MNQFLVRNKKIQSIIFIYFMVISKKKYEKVE
jgi:hypothetical protein